MSVLSLTLLGDLACALDGRPLRFARRSALALVVYLACMGRVQRRAVLATLLVGESDEASASMTLRNALRDLRAVLGDALQADTRTVTLAPTVELVTDVAQFEAAARAGLEQHSPGVLREAVAGYSGEFAPGFVHDTVQPEDRVRGLHGLAQWFYGETTRWIELYRLNQAVIGDDRSPLGQASSSSSPTTPPACS